MRQWKEAKREKSELQKLLDRVKPKNVELEERLRLYDIALDQFLAEVSAIVGDLKHSSKSIDLESMRLISQIPKPRLLRHSLRSS
jgi:hypothetical protein